MALALRDLPRYLVLEPRSSVRVEMRLITPACEIDVELDNQKPGRSFVLLIGHKNGPFVQRVRLAGKARIYFDPRSPGEYVLLVANPQDEPIVLRLKAREVGPVAVVRSRSAKRATKKGGAPKESEARGRRSPPKGAVRSPLSRRP